MERDKSSHPCRFFSCLSIIFILEISTGMEKTRKQFIYLNPMDIMLNEKKLYANQYLVSHLKIKMCLHHLVVRHKVSLPWKKPIDQ